MSHFLSVFLIIKFRCFWWLGLFFSKTLETMSMLMSRILLSLALLSSACSVPLLTTYSESFAQHEVIIPSFYFPPFPFFFALCGM
jgi:hypothetical protein